MKRLLSKLLIKLYKSIVGKEPCIVYKRYYSYTKQIDGFQNNCPFCHPSNKVDSFRHFYIIENLYPYPKTIEHLLIIPKRHIVKYNELSNTELKELRNILGEYMSKGYLLLGRQFGDHKESSVAHLHLHLIKEDS